MNFIHQQDIDFEQDPVVARSGLRQAVACHRPSDRQDDNICVADTQA